MRNRDAGSRGFIVGTQEPSATKCIALMLTCLLFACGGSSSNETLGWPDPQPEDGSMLGWSNIVGWMPQSPFRPHHLPTSFHVVVGDGTLYEYGEVNLVGERMVARLTRVFGPPVKMKQGDAAIPVVPGSLHIPYAQVVLTKQGQPFFVVYFDKIRVYLDSFRESPILAVDEMTGSLRYVYQQKGAPRSGGLFAEVIWRRGVDETGALETEIIADVFLGGNMVEKSAQPQLMAEIGEPRQKWEDRLEEAQGLLQGLGNHEPLRSQNSVG